ncbi:ANTAR domain-containing protein [Egicoccus sp. AB-alg6-2]|uniref:ANTAR domain-containing protein n=1 Tax=Egicoccus sp. AB-alg6-2 TaxID=3242692 RepID=UPI00359DE663
MTSSHLLAAVREFTTTILNPYDLPDLLHRLTDHATMVTGAQGCGIMLAGNDGLGFAAASDDGVVDVEVTQDRIDDGPCHAAYERDQTMAIGDLEAEDRWPEYRQRALESGFRAVLGIPMRAWGQTIGVLDIYRRAPGPWSDTDRDAAEIMTAMGAGYILHANQMRAQHELADQLQTALTSRDIIGQAKGLLMARHRVDADEAFDMLRSTSQRGNMKLREVAAKVIEAENARA